MLIREHPPLHLTYCLNVHPGETWQEVFRAISTHAIAVRDLVSPGKPFGLGLRLSRQAAADLLADPRKLADLRAFLAGQALYAFTINGFPYGAFHGKPVKTSVYQPGWSQPERLEYTRLLGEILSRILPEGVEGSISTVPLAYGRHDRGEAELRAFAANLADCVAGLHALRSATGHEIHLGLEPEPDCMLDRTDDVLAFFAGPLQTHCVPALARLLRCAGHDADAILRRHLGVCLDTCHLAVRFEDPAESIRRFEEAGIRISKVQISAAVEALASAAGRERLRDFCDPVYLHQVSARSGADAPLRTARDLEEALDTAWPGDTASPGTAPGTWRVHCHVPLYFEGDGPIRSTASALTPAFWQRLVRNRVSHLEVETYTFNVLPPALRAGGVERSIAREFEWVSQRLRAALP